MCTHTSWYGRPNPDDRIMHICTKGRMHFALHVPSLCDVMSQSEFTTIFILYLFSQKIILLLFSVKNCFVFVFKENFVFVFSEKLSDSSVRSTQTFYLHHSWPSGDLLLNLQWGSDQRTSSVFEWQKVVRQLNGSLLKP